MSHNDHSTVSMLADTLTPDVYQRVRDFWFSHIPDTESLMMPGKDAMMRWFSKDAEFDRSCVVQFRPILEKIRIHNVSADDILAFTSHISPLDQLSVLLLLDQISRNCYRDSESATVFTVFDPLARSLALRAADQSGIIDSPDIRLYLARRMWFGMPLMHSEDLALHHIAMRQFDRISQDIEELMGQEGTLSQRSEEDQRAYAQFTKNREATRAFVANQVSFEKRHLVIIEQFGRYPHRNDALGRVPTPEEVQYLENGGDAF